MAADRHRAYFAADHFWRYCPCSFLLDGEPVMAMFRRSPRSPSPFRHRQEELARQESELRESVEKLERSIAAAPRVAEETARRQREELPMRAKTGGNPLAGAIARRDQHARV